MNQIDPYLDKARSELDVLEAEIGKLKATAAKADAQSRIRFVRYVDELESQCHSLGERLASMKEPGEYAADYLKRGLKDARDRLAIAKRAAKARFH